MLKLHSTIELLNFSMEGYFSPTIPKIITSAKAYLNQALILPKACLVNLVFFVRKIGNTPSHFDIEQKPESLLSHQQEHKIQKWV